MTATKWFYEWVTTDRDSRWEEFDTKEEAIVRRGVIRQALGMKLSNDRIYSLEVVF